MCFFWEEDEEEVEGSWILIWAGVWSLGMMCYILLNLDESSLFETIQGQLGPPPTQLGLVSPSPKTNGTLHSHLHYPTLPH